MCPGRNSVKCLRIHNLCTLHDTMHAAVNNLINVMFSNHLQPPVLHPIAITDRTSMLIDNIFVNTAIGSSMQSNNIFSLISDHMPQFCIISEFMCDDKNLTHNISKLLKLFLFADDTNIYFESDDATHLAITINKELKKVKPWIDCNKLVIKIDKTHFVLFHSPSKSYLI